MPKRRRSTKQLLALRLRSVAERRLMLFDQRARTDKSPNHFGESQLEFLNRSGSEYSADVRSLLDDWLDHVPDAARASMEGALRGDNDAFQSAFWELYLHDAYRRSGYSVEIHPDVPGTGNHPDFRIERGAERFYLEAVRVGRTPADVGEQNRLDEV